MRRGVGGQHAAQAVDHEHALVERLEYEAVPRLALGQRALGARQVGDVGCNTDHAVEDAIAATTWIAANGKSLRIDQSRLMVGGDSAGGNLAAVVAIAARDGDGPAIAGQVLIYPAIDFALTHPSHQEPETSILLTHSVIRWFRDHYLNSAADVDDWRASPVRTKTLIGLPPTYVLTAGADPLRDEGNEYALRLKEAGVPVTYRTFPGQFHGFFTMGKLLQQANVAATEIGVWLKELK